MLRDYLPAVAPELMAISAADVPAMKSAGAAFESFGTYLDEQDDLDLGDHRPQRARVAQVSASMFSLLQVAPAMGRGIAVAEDAPGHHVVVLSDQSWRTQMAANPNVLERTVAVQSQPCTVVGVMPRGFEFLPRGVA